MAGALFPAAEDCVVLRLPWPVKPACRFIPQVPDEEENEESDTEKEPERSDSAADSGPTFNYLLDMPLWYLTKEKKDELCRLRNEKVSC